jgi:hypothetical protein
MTNQQKCVFLAVTLFFSYFILFLVSKVCAITAFCNKHPPPKISVDLQKLTLIIFGLLQETPRKQLNFASKLILLPEVANKLKKNKSLTQTIFYLKFRYYNYNCEITIVALVPLM